MFYDRKIRYWDYRRDGERLRGAGFLKLEVRDGVCDLTIQISGLHRTDSFLKEVYLMSGEREALLCAIHVQGGQGSRQLRLHMEDLEGGIAYEDLESLRIPLASGCELYCKVAEPKTGQTAKELGEAVWTETAIHEEELPREAEMPEQNEPVIEEESGEGLKISREAELVQEQKVPQPERQPTQDHLPGQQETPTWKQPGRRRMLEDKWHQLSAIYPPIHPFQDQREYLRLGPEDFVILHNRFYKLVHNSFLLHGYYNYQHLILTRLERQGELVYYIGVPGNFYDREKQVAVMYGFESFECREEPAGEGDFGYYMIRVEL